MAEGNNTANWSRELMFAFERADLDGNNEWFDSHWPIYKRQMVLHMYSTCFAWTAFKEWAGATNHNEEMNRIIGRLQNFGV